MVEVTATNERRTKLPAMRRRAEILQFRGMLKRGLSDEGLHPNASGYKVMAPLAEKAIAQAIASRP
jgi:lysophospholipase L1-like esterase